MPRVRGQRPFRTPYVAVLATLLGGWLLASAPPAAASHDPYEAGTVILGDRPGAQDRVIVVFPHDAAEDDIRVQVTTHAARKGLDVRNLTVKENMGPDTLRVFVVTDLGERTGLLAGRVPADRITAWRELANQREAVLSVSRWAQVDGAVANGSGDYVVTGERDISYRLSPWILLIPLLLLLAAAVLPYVALRGLAERAVRAGGNAEEQLHRIRRGMVAVQLVTPLALVGTLFATGTLNWVQVILAEAAPGLRLPGVLTALLGVIGSMTPYLLAFVASAAAFMPYDRRLRGTRQSTRSGVGQAVRAFALVFLPALLWSVLLVFLLPLGAVAILAMAALFGLTFVALAPVLFNKLMTTGPLDPALRDRVLSACADQGLEVRDARLLDSRGGKVANAAISGILPRLRYVFLSDRLVEILDDDELDAVLAHEISHGRGHHLLIKLAASLAPLVALMLLLTTAGKPLLRELSGAASLIVVLLVLQIAVVGSLLLTQGLLGIALEKRADDYAAKTVGVRPLADALEKLADANKMKRRTGWLWNVLQQHPGMESRIRRLNQAAERADRSMPSGDADAQP